MIRKISDWFRIEFQFETFARAPFSFWNRKPFFFSYSILVFLFLLLKLRKKLFPHNIYDFDWKN